MKPGKIAIISSRNWDDFVSTLRQVTLAGDSKLRPYLKARITSCVVDADKIRPLSFYALKNKISMQQKLHELLLKEHKINTLDLDGKSPEISFTVSGERGIWSMAPPIVEVSARDGGVPLLVDGEHRFLLAKSLGLPIRVVWIEQIPEYFPTVAKPVTWDEVVTYESVPPLAKKRHFRFPSLKSFPDISVFSKEKITVDNFQYFFYRDLSPVCTSGIRIEGET